MRGGLLASYVSFQPAAGPPQEPAPSRDTIPDPRMGQGQTEIHGDSDRQGEAKSDRAKHQTKKPEMFRCCC